METENIFIAHPKTIEQINALEAIVKAFKIDYEVSRKSDKSALTKEIQESLLQVKKIQKGKLAKQSAKDFLNEL